MDPATSREQECSAVGHGGEDQTGLAEWNPKHKIFLSHNGKEKEFVRQLCKDLEAETHQPFFDEQSTSLAMGERFAPRILEAARQCLVAVVVLSEDFLTSKWPMLELVEFVKAKKSCNPRMKLFPLFYKLSPEDLKVECIESRWKDAWAGIITASPGSATAPGDTRRELNLSLCTEALGELRGSHGLKFQNFTSEVAYRAAIVKEINLLVEPDLLDDTSDVVGNDRLCKVLGGMFVEDTIEGSDLRGTHKLGLYGMGGLGKTTMSRALCVFYFRQFNGRVFHVELGSRPPLDLQKLVLTKLLRINKDVVERVHTVHEGRKLLRDHMRRQPVFLAIDNITNDRESKKEALAYLEAGFHPGSMIMITSRSVDVIEELFPGGVYCKAMTSLSEEEAGLIFLRRAAPGRKLDTLTIEEQEILKECLSQCHFEGADEKMQYHPLALQALADYYNSHDNYNVLSWKEHLKDLDKLRLANASSDIFGVLGLQFRTLTVRVQLLFLDLCLYWDSTFFSAYVKNPIGWLVDVHEDTPTAVKLQLQSLRRSGIINITFSEDGDQFVSIHDLYREFAKWYVIDGEGSRLAELGCVYHSVSSHSLPYVLKRTSPLAYQFQRIRLQNLTCAKFPAKKVQEWCNVVVLQIHDCSNLQVLDLHGLSCLRHLELKGLTELESFRFTESEPHSISRDSADTLDSLQHVVLANLTSLKRMPDFSLCHLLKTFRMEYCALFVQEPPSFHGCSQLEDLNMDWNARWWRTEVFNLHTLTSLTSLRLGRPNQISPPVIKNREGEREPWMELHLEGLGGCAQLRKLRLHGLPITSLRGLEKLTELRSLSVSHCSSLRQLPDLSALVQLNTLWLRMVKIAQVPGLESLLQLSHFYCMRCEELTTLPDLDHLPKLIQVIMQACASLEKRPQVPQLCYFYNE